MNIWQPMSSAPRDGTPIEALYADSAADEFDVVQWEEYRCCMLGPRAGAYPPGWQSVENKLPVDDPVLWRPVSGGKP